MNPSNEHEQRESDGEQARAEAEYVEYEENLPIRILKVLEATQTIDEDVYFFQYETHAYITSHFLKQLRSPKDEIIKLLEGKKEDMVAFFDKKIDEIKSL